MEYQTQTAQEEAKTHITNIVEVKRLFNFHYISKTFGIQKDTFRNNVLGISKRNNFSEEDKDNIARAIFPAVKKMFSVLGVEVTVGVNEDLRIEKEYTTFLLERIAEQQKEIEALKFRAKQDI